MQANRKKKFSDAKNVFYVPIALHFTYSSVRTFCTLTESVIPFENLFFKCCGDPRHFNSPLTIMASRVQSASHSSILCDVSTIDLSEFRTFDIIFQKLRFEPGSIPDVGSSFEVKNEIGKQNWKKKS